MSTLQSWLEEFQSLGYPVGDSAKVLPQDGDDGADTGLIVFRLRNAPTLAYLQPDMSAMEWHVTMEARDEPSTMTAAAVMNLAFELSVLSALSAFLQTKSRDFLRRGRT